MTRTSVLLLLALPAVVFLLVFFVLPLSVLVLEAGTDGGSAFGRLWADAVFWKGLQGSLVLGTAAPLFSTAVGYGVALFLARCGERRRTALLFAISLPLTFSGLTITTRGIR